LAAISPYLLPVAASRQIPHPFGHDFRQASVGTRSPLALGDFEQIQEHLTADALKSVKEIDLAANPLKHEPPRISGLCRGSFRRFFS
jgi:hypothetical protein